MKEKAMNTETLSHVNIESIAHAYIAQRIAARDSGSEEDMPISAESLRHDSDASALAFVGDDVRDTLRRYADILECIDTDNERTLRDLATVLIADYRGIA